MIHYKRSWKQSATHVPNRTPASEKPILKNTPNPIFYIATPKRKLLHIPKKNKRHEKKTDR